MRVVFSLLVVLLVCGDALGQTATTPTPRRPAPRPTQPAPARTPPASSGMTNGDVIKMVAAGLSQDIVLVAIERAEKRAFNLSVDGLVSLKKGGVSDAIILAMQNAGGSINGGTPVRPPATAVSTVPRPPAETKVSLKEGTEFKVRLLKEISSEIAKVDDRVEFEVPADVLIDGSIVVRQGAVAWGKVTEAQPKGLTRGGRLNFSVDYVTAVDDQNIRLRATRELAADRTALVRGRPMVVAPGTELVVTVDADRPITLNGSSGVSVAKPPTPPSTAPGTGTAVPAAVQPSAPGSALKPAATVSGPEQTTTPPTARTDAQATNAPTPVAAQAQTAPVNKNWKKDLETRLETQWRRAKLTFMKDNIRQPGAPLLLMQGGVLADRDSYPTNDVVGGVLRPQSTSNKLGALLNEARDRESVQHRVTLQRYQPMFLTDALVSNDRVTLQLATNSQFIFESVDRAAIARFADGSSLKGDTLTKVDASIRKAALVFHFQKDALQQQSPEAVIAIINQMLLPPDHPDAPQFGTVGVGMTREQVIRNIGKPQNVVKLDDDREILVFDKIKVTLRGGKVVDVQ
jgi:hypothetical protein